MDTQEEPIVWATVCRALRIRRFIPQSQLYKSSLPQVVDALPKHTEVIDNQLEIELPEDPYELLANDVRYIKGIKGRIKPTAV